MLDKVVTTNDIEVDTDMAYEPFCRICTCTGEYTRMCKCMYTCQLCTRTHAQIYLSTHPSYSHIIASEDPTCKMIRPCKCSGTSSYVHVTCLQKVW